MKTQGAVARREREHNLKTVLAEATQALSHLDAERLEEMALSCEALVADNQVSEEEVANGESKGRDANDMAIFLRVLEATKANLNVMRRLREAHMAQLQRDPAGMGEYGDH
jgi:hypothetical protein